MRLNVHDSEADVVAFEMAGWTSPPRRHRPHPRWYLARGTNCSDASAAIIDIECAPSSASGAIVAGGVPAGGMGVSRGGAHSDTPEDRIMSVNLFVSIT